MFALQEVAGVSNPGHYLPKQGLRSPPPSMFTKLIPPLLVKSDPIKAPALSTMTEGGLLRQVLTTTTSETPTLP